MRHTNTRKKGERISQIRFRTTKLYIKKSETVKIKTSLLQKTLENTVKMLL